MNEKRNKNSTPVSSADVEQNTSNGAMGAKEFAPLDSQCRINIHSIRKRLVDADGVSAKAAIDGLVHAGILHDDSPEFVASVTYTQERTKTAEECTIITITEI